MCTFLKDCLLPLQLDVHPISAFPSVIFLICVFLYLHISFHSRTTHGTPLKWFVLREISLQLWFTYLHHIWMVWLHCVKSCLLYCELHLKDTTDWLTPRDAHASILSIHTVISCVPLCFLIHLYLRRRLLPQVFFFGEIDGGRTEIGICAYYLTRPYLGSEDEGLVKLRKSRSVGVLKFHPKPALRRRCSSLCIDKM
ncbi:uncharacterized protein LOC116181113 [Photinus pyralis]|uniref:uncharacterized protein LOC116181113 n=1 Tax=Photinus pyralis TaxID=7054 RepID=UPI001267619C|nr:uncharacterized protein LOC116181113 [Photinus pyralis]